jgi:hypothetical protein
MPVTINGSGQLAVQIKQTVKTDTFVTSATVTDTPVTGLSVTITPTSASNKILIICNLSMSSENAQGGAPKLRRNGTAIFVADAAGSRSRGSFAGGGYRGAAAGSGEMLWNENLTAIDSPATTSAITYDVVVSSITNATWVNRPANDNDTADRLRSVSYITVMEISG